MIEDLRIGRPMHIGHQAKSPRQGPKIGQHGRVTLAGADDLPLQEMSGRGAGVPVVIPARLGIARVAYQMDGAETKTDGQGQHRDLLPLHR